MSTAFETYDWQELAHRQAGGIDVALLWRKIRNTNILKLLVEDAMTGEAGDIYVPPEKAMDAFNHPYAYLPGRLAVAETVSSLDSGEES